MERTSYLSKSSLSDCLQVASRFFQVWALSHQANVYGCFEGESFQGEPSVRDRAEESVSAHQSEAGPLNVWLKRKQNRHAQNGLHFSPVPLGLIQITSERGSLWIIRVQGREGVGGCPGLSLGSQVTLRRGDGNPLEAAPCAWFLCCVIFFASIPVVSS